jgi:hypothetical protein
MPPSRHLATAKAIGFPNITLKTMSGLAQIPAPIGENNHTVQQL